MPLSDVSIQAIRDARALMPIPRTALLFGLRTVQRECGQVGSEEVEVLAELFELPPAQVEGVARFYDLITREPTAPHRFRLCEGVVCAVRGMEAVWDVIRDPAGSPVINEAIITIERGACLGHCDHAPAGLFDGVLVGPLDPPDALRLLTAATAGGISP